MNAAPLPSRALGTLSEFIQVRLFFGLDPSAEDKRALGEWRDQYAYADGRPVPIDNLHLTLAFIGEVDNRQLDSLCIETDEWLSDRTAIVVTLELDRVGYFPRPSIYWLGCSAVDRDLENLQAGVRGRALNAGARRESRAWVPHVTLYRQCEAPSVPLREPRFTLKFEHLTLFESLSGRSGVRYEPVAEWTI